MPGSETSRTDVRGAKSSSDVPPLHADTRAVVGYIDTDRRKVVYPFASREFPLKPEEQVRLIMVTRLIHEYGYLPDQIGLEVSVRSGQTTLLKKADIVVFRTAAVHDPASHAYIIVEVKKRDRKDGVDQLQTYCNNTTAQFGVWFNGNDIVYQHRRREPHQFDDIPDIPAVGETLEDVGRFNKDDLVPATDLRSVFETIHNQIYANQGFLKEKVFHEMLKIIFIKMIDEKSLAAKSDFRITEKELRAVEEGKGDAFVQRITNLFVRVKREYNDVFDANELINLKPTTLAFVVSQLQRFNLRETPADIKGIAFQTFVSANQRGDRGEFFTPHPIVELMVEMVAPRDAEMLIDPACGSGGFLVYAMAHVWNLFRRKRGFKDVDLLKYAHNYIRGIDFNPDLAKVAKMYMVLHDDGHTGIFGGTDALEEWPVLAKAATAAGVKDVQANTFDIVLTNPPFGSKGKVTSKRLLALYHLGHKWRQDKKTKRWVETKTLMQAQVPDILFIERCLDLLVDGGRMAIVLPNSDLNNISLEYVRQFIKERARIVGIISLPVGTFMSSGSNPQPSVVYLQKMSKSAAAELNKNGYAIFMAALKSIGYDLTTKTAPTIYRKDSSGLLERDPDGNLIVDSDVPEVLRGFEAFRAKHGLELR